MLVGELRELFRSFGRDYRPESPAASEAQLLNDMEIALGVVGQAAFLYESISDHVVATARILGDPIQSIAPFSLVRASVEVSSICCWILDPTLTALNRVARSFALRRKGLEGQETIIRENPQTDDGRLAERYAYLERKEKQYGIEKVGMPSTTDLVAFWFGGRHYYRLASAVVHGHPWVISQVGFERSDAEAVAKGTVFLEPTLKPSFILYLLMLALDALARAAWLRTLYSGHDRDRMARVLEKAYDDMQILSSRWFWRAG
jgi:hypothetical protein